MSKRYSIRERFGRSSGIVQAIIDRLASFGISVSENDVYNSLCESTKKPKAQEAVRAAYDYFDKNWERLQKEKLQEIAG